MEHREGPRPALDDPRRGDPRLGARLGTAAAPHRTHDVLHPPAAPARRLGAVPDRAAALDGRARVRPRLPSPPHAALRSGHHACALRRAATHRHRELRPRPAAVGVHAVRGAGRPGRRTRRARPEGASLRHRRRRGHGVARALRRPRRRRDRGTGSRDPGRDRARRLPHALRRARRDLAHAAGARWVSRNACPAECCARPVARSATRSTARRKRCARRGRWPARSRPRWARCRR